MSDATGLREVLAGHVGDWRWEPGLSPAAVAAALGTSVSPGPIRYAGRPRQAATLQVAGQPWPVWAVWDEAGEELVLIEVLEPPEAPAEAEAIAAFGEPDTRLGRDRGPHPSDEQLAWLGRGFTLFAWGGAPPEALWLYRPTDFDDYAAQLGATITPTRPHR